MLAKGETGMKIATISATEAKNRFGDVLRRAYRSQEHLVVERGGIPVVAIVPISDYEQFLSQVPDEESGTVEADLSTASAQNQAGIRLMEFLAEMHAQMPDVPEEQVQREIEEAIAAVRAENR